MKYSFVALALATSSAFAVTNVTYTTEVVTALTTYCPAATQFAYGNVVSCQSESLSTRMPS